MKKGQIYIFSKGSSKIQLHVGARLKFIEYANEEKSIARMKFITINEIIYRIPVENLEPDVKQVEELISDPSVEERMGDWIVSLAKTGKGVLSFLAGEAIEMGGRSPFHYVREMYVQLSTQDPEFTRRKLGEELSLELERIFE